MGHGIPKVAAKTLELQILVGLKTVVHQQEEKVERSKVKRKADLDAMTFELQPPVPVQGDIKMECSDKQITFAWCFHTGFVASQWKPEGPYTLILRQTEVDKAIKDKQNKIFPKGFHIEIVFNMLQSDIAEQGKVY